MRELINWLYDHYIQPHLENQPRDGEAELHFSLLESALRKEERKDLAFVCRFYALQGFRLGVKTGVALGKELESL